jgi:PKD repeat protein
MKKNCYSLFRALLIFVFACVTAQVSAQVFEGERGRYIANHTVENHFSTWEVYRLDAAAMYDFVENGPDHAPLRLTLGTHRWELQLTPSQLFGASYQLRLHDESGEQVLPSTVRPFQGTTSSGGVVRLTLDDDFVYGYVVEGDETVYIEPLWYLDPSADRDLFIVYPKSAVIRHFNAENECAMVEHEEMGKRAEDHVEDEHGHESARMLACYQLDLAIASDASMLTKYGSAAAVEAHNVAVINNVEGDYTGNFNHDIEFNIVTQFVSAANPWGADPAAGTYLSNFRTWGNNGGFGVPFDLGEMWTNIDLTGSTIGIAYLSAVCTSNRYHVLQDFSSNEDLLRCLTSHEIGHNFSAQHDNCPNNGPFFIMCPFVTTSTNWSAASVSSIDAFTQTRINNGCLSPCSSGPPPTPDFSWSPDPGCVGQQVQFTDESTGTINSRTWAFPGGTPATSTATNPTVTWATAGVKNVTLTLNSGTGTQAAITKQVTIVGLPTANFTYTVDGLTVMFNSTTTNATSFEWDFGDGGISSEEDPEYTYSFGGFYTVILTATGPCGTATRTLTINTAPSPEFSTLNQEGCAPMTVSFINESSNNAISYLWQFEGGSPGTSNSANPIVFYNAPGTYNVTLTASNSQGSQTIVKPDFITVRGIPVTNFIFIANGNTVTFTNISTGGTSYLWEFGDGNESTLFSPIHTYAVGGTYTVTLTTTNECGSSTSVKTVVLTAPPVAAFTGSPTSGCGPLTVQFNSTTTGTPATLLWQFPGGTPSSSTASNPTVTYANAGAYSVTLTATNAAGSNTATQTNYITVNPAPTAAFGVSNSSGATVSFANSSSGGATSYAWNFGDGGTSGATNPTHTYLNDGTYTVTLTAINACGATTATQTVTIVTPPTANFTTTNSTGCAPLSVQFTSTSSANATSFAWQFSGGTPATSTAQNPTVTYSTPGSYSVTLTVTNAAGSNTNTQTNVVQVQSAPTAAFGSTANGLQVNFNNTSTGGTTYAWNFGNGNTSTATSPTHTYAAAGAYTVTLTATNACGTNTATQVVTVVQTPTAAFTATNATGCAPLTVQFSSTSSGNPTSVLWQFPGGNPSSSTATNPTVVYANPGMYSVTLTATNSAGSGSTTQTNIVNVGTVPSSASFASIVNGAIATFTNTSIGATTYAWNFGDGGTSTATSPTHTYANDGTYTVTLTSSNTCGSVTATQTVTIVTPPAANFTAVNTVGCAPLTVQFSNASSANATSFAWQFPGGNPTTSTAANPTVTYNNPGVYNVTLTATNAAGNSTVTQNNFVTVGTVPVAGFLGSVNSGTVVFTNTSNNATGYVWNFGDPASGAANASTATNPNHTYATDGTYTVTLTATNACGSTTTTQVITVVTPPTAGFSVSGANGCAPLVVQYTSTSSANATSFAWQFPGGTPTTSTAQNPTVTYANQGTYGATLTVSNSAGNNSNTQINIVTVNTTPTALFVATPAGNSVVFENLTNNATGATYLWDFGDSNSSTGTNPTHVYTADGSYTVVMVATNACGSTIYSQVVNIATPPTANFTSSNPIGCAPLTIQFTNASSANATNFEWQFPGGTPASSIEANPVVIYADPGTYSVILVASNSVGLSEIIQTNLVQVNDVPLADFGYTTAGLSAVFVNNSLGSTTYFWDFGDGSTSTEASPTHNFGAAGEYTVSLRVTNECGTVETNQVVSIVGSAPLSAFTTNEGAAGCAPLTVNFVDQSVGDPTTWSWVFQGGTPSTSTDQNPVVTYATPGAYSVELTTTNAFGTNTALQSNYVQVGSAPVVTIAGEAQGGTVLFTSVVQNGGSNYTWNFGDGSPVSNEPNPTHTYAATGTYLVQLTVENDCGITTAQLSVSVVVIGVEDPTWAESFRLFPNPNYGTFTLEMHGQPQGELQLTLHNTLGQLISQQVLDFGAGTLLHTLDYGRTLAPGVYTLSLQSADGVNLQRKLVVLHR